MEMEAIGRRIFELKKLGAGDKQCEDCLHSSFPLLHGINVCKKCIAESPAFTDLAKKIIQH